MDRFLTGRRALVVGGSGGIGAAVTLALARCGAELVVHGGRDRERLERIAAAAGALTAEVRSFLLEITGPGDADAVLSAAGRVDILVVAFGPWMEAAVDATSPDEWRRMVDLNLTLPALLISAVIPGMKDRGYGRILVFGGPRSDRPEGYTRIAAYGAAKHGLASLVRSTARQYSAHNIRCNMICPGYVATEYYEPGKLAEIARKLPGGGRVVTTDEVAALAIHLLRPESDAVSGAIIPIDFAS